MTTAHSEWPEYKRAPAEAGGVIVNVDVDLLPFRISSWICLFFVTLLPANAQRPRGHGAMSAQDMAKMAVPEVAGTDTADQVCGRFPVGSATTAAPELKSQNGVLEVTMKFLRVTDTQGLIRYCYVTDTGLQAPTLRVNPGDQLIIHFQNDLPAAAHNMAGRKVGLLLNESGSGARDSKKSSTPTNLHLPA